MGLAARAPALALVCAVACSVACGGDPPAPPQATAPGRVLVVGIDGAAPRLVFPWLEEGALPNLAALARAGVSGPLRAHRPLLSPRIWTSVVTGKGPAGHGIFHWLHEDAEGRLRLLRSDDRQGHALWNIASDAGLRVAVVNWLNTYPPEIVDGVVVSDFAVPGQREERLDLGHVFAKQISGGAQERVAEPQEGAPGATVHPAAWQPRVARLAAEVAAEGDDPFAAHAPALRPSLRELLPRMLRADRVVARIALEVERETRPDLMLVYLPGIDRVSHFLWAAIDTLHPYPESLRMDDDERAAARAALRTYYQLTDAFVGELVARFSAEDLVIVLSDHGFEARVLEDHEITGGHESARAEHGVLFARGPGIPAGERAGPVGVDDLTPTILAWLGLPLARDMDGRAAHFLEPAAPPPEPIASYDGEIQRLEGTAPEVEAHIIEQLRSFGYVEE